MYKSDKLYDEMKAIEKQIKELDVKDAKTCAEYIRLYTLLIYNYKWLGSIYDIYDGNAVILRGNGNKLEGAAAMVKDTTELLAAFPDLELTFSDIFAVPVGKDQYKLWRHFYLDGTNLGYSKYGKPTGRALEGKKSIGLAMSALRLTEGKWKIIEEYIMYSDEWMREVCTA